LEKLLNVNNIISTTVKTKSYPFTEIERYDKLLFQHFKNIFSVQDSLTRLLVSFQANKSRPVYRWYKYKEAFSAALVENFLQKCGITKGIILDPFAGSGTALFAASGMGINADGIELLPIGQEIILTKKILDSEFTKEDLERLKSWSVLHIWKRSKKIDNVHELRITKGAYPEQTKESIGKYLSACRSENIRVKTVLQFALLCILESISFTRKDGQFLRWDYRSGRKQGKTVFNKGEILTFDLAISDKINEIVEDFSSEGQTELFPVTNIQGAINLYSDSCLNILPRLGNNHYDAIITSPPYCNRYDYTRTYALELALLGITEQELSSLRQSMISCTVENRSKELLQINSNWEKAIEAAEQQRLLQAILKYLEDQKNERALNNNGIPRMVKGYFYEMACIIYECSRILRPGAPLIMVNDNVRYAGVSISVDMILSELAEDLGFKIEKIFVLPNAKGNSSQQMGLHGREALRKCVYIWRKK
jgi:DNA modification methylase